MVWVNCGVFFICHANVDLESDADSSIGPTHRYVARAMRPALSWSYINAIIMLVLVTVFSWFISEPASSIFSYTKSAPVTNQPTVFLFYNKSALATSHSQSNRASDFGTYVSLLSIWASRDHLQIHEDSLTSDGAPADHFIKFLMDRQ